LHDNCWRSGEKERHSQSGVKPPHSKVGPQHGYSLRRTIGGQQPPLGARFDFDVPNELQYHWRL
jgi:hypothetical protein